MNIFSKKKKNVIIVEDERSEKSRLMNIFAAGSFLTFFVVIGLPIWWFTTSVYRSPLPYDEIASLEESTAEFPVYVNLVTDDQMLLESINQLHLDRTMESEIFEQLHERVKLTVRLATRLANKEELAIIRAANGQLAKIDLEMERKGSSVAEGVEIFITTSGGEPKTAIYFGSGKRLYVRSQSGEAALERELVDVILNGYLRVEKLRRIVEYHSGKERSLKRSVEVSSEALSPNCALEIHVLDPEPTSCQSTRLDVRHLLNGRKLAQFLTGIEAVTKIEMKSQTLYYVDFPYEPRHDKATNVHYLDGADLADLINRVEPYLGSAVTTDPVFHALIYVTPSNKEPLEFYSEKEKVGYSNFLVPGWGAVIAANLGNVSCDRIGDDQSQLEKLENSLLTHLRRYFDLNLPPRFQRSPVSIANWEVYSLQYRALVEYTFSSVRTLRSLAKLLEQISNIVINDQIGEDIRSAVAELRLVVPSGDEEPIGNGHLDSVLKSATMAWKRAESAFFDQSLLALLYFPEDQKYAIYIPLFLPVGLPVLGSLFTIIKYIKQVRKKKTD